MTRIPKAWLLKPVAVRWLDHVGYGAEWVAIADLEKNDKLETFTTIGFLLKVEKDRIVLGSCLDDKHTTSGDITALVRSCITSLHPIEIGDF